MHGVRDFCPVFASFVRAGHEPVASQYCHLKVAVHSTNKERQNPIEGGEKMHGVRDLCPVFASFVRAGHEPVASQYCHLKVAIR
jgi:inhibitor of KinA sporulation pathway (predicted exonuclease)